MLEGSKPSPYHFSASELANIDVVGPLVQAEPSAEEPPVTLSSSKSGIRLTFETNRTSEVVVPVAVR